MSENVQNAFSELEALYAGIENAVGETKCMRCGACCHFEKFGHRLYATRLEALYLVSLCGAPAAGVGARVCGYQQGSDCTAREGRTLACRTFYCDRAGVFELLRVSEPIRELILRRERASALKAMAVSTGMRSLRADGIAKASEGITTMDEVARVTGRDEF